ncbi:MAG TPA: PD-(D/E)XK nuclease family protein, partial [Vicinamibacterales bacterium]|nr:PD-(D/E)XK nuclease family protein [Vicinamibacterales bacterium]
LEPANLEPPNLEPPNLEPPNLEPANLEPANLEPPNLEPPRSSRLAGTLVHRLLQRVGFSALPGDAVRALASRLVRPDEIDDLDGLEALLDAAAASYAAICASEEVRELYSAGRRLHDVPFTTTVEGRVLRGTVDCLVETAPDRLTLLEFRTGRERPEHRTQGDLYLQAMRQAFPGASIDARVIHAFDDFARI